MTTLPTSSPIAGPSSPTTPPARRVRRYAQGAALVLFPALLVAEAPLDPTGNGSGEDLYVAATQHQGPLVVSAVLLLVSAFLMAPAAAAVLHQARDRGAGLANVGAALAVLGGFGHAGIAMFYILGSALPGGDQGEMVAYIDRLNSSPVLGFVVFPLIYCLALGVLILPWAAWRAGAIGWWAPAVATAAVLVEEVLPSSSPFVSVGTLTAITVVFGAIGVRVLRMKDAEWEGTPQAVNRSATVGA